MVAFDGSWILTCHPCQVRWGKIDSPDCWVCGQPGTGFIEGIKASMNLPPSEVAHNPHAQLVNAERG